MQFPFLLGIKDLKELIVKKYNQDLQDIRSWWNDHDSGARQWTELWTMGFQTNTVSKTANYTALLTDNIILVDATSGAVTITLPTAVGITGKWYLIKDWKGQAGTHLITVAPSGGQVIDGSSNQLIRSNYDALFVVSDGANWSVITENIYEQGGIIQNPLALKGFKDGSSAAAGFVGEYISSTATTASSGTTNYFDVTSISLTAGDWDISVTAVYTDGGGVTSRSDVGISTTAGNSSVGLTTGVNYTQALPPTASNNTGSAIVAYQQSISSTTIYYLKGRLDFTVSSGNIIGRITARRMR